MTQHERRHDPYPWTWEIPVGVLLTIGLLLVLGIHLGRGVANLTAGGGFDLPARLDLFSSVPAVLRGDVSAGLPDHHQSAATPTAALVWIAVIDVAVLVVCLWLLKAGLDRWGSGRMRGMASRSEAERRLGLTRLRKASPVIRPDLHHTRRRRR